MCLNSILSGEHAENARSLAALSGILAQSGRLIALFPTVLCPLELVHILTFDAIPPEVSSVSTISMRDRIDIKNSAFLDPADGLWKHCYTPNRLRMLLIECGFAIESMEVLFCDSPEELAQAEASHGISAAARVALWQILVVAGQVKASCRGEPG